jgi:hypothetical protein
MRTPARLKRVAPVSECHGECAQRSEGVQCCAPTESLSHNRCPRAGTKGICRKKKQAYGKAGAEEAQPRRYSGHNFLLLGWGAGRTLKFRREGPNGHSPHAGKHGRPFVACNAMLGGGIFMGPGPGNRNYQNGRSSSSSLESIRTFCPASAVFNSVLTRKSLGYRSESCVEASRLDRNAR